jgi:hypothetical protein
LRRNSSKFHIPLCLSPSPQTLHKEKSHRISHLNNFINLRKAIFQISQCLSRGRDQYLFYTSIVKVDIATTNTLKKHLAIDSKLTPSIDRLSAAPTMVSNLDFSKQFGDSFVPEDKDQALVITPFGNGVVLRTRPNDTKMGETMKDIALTDWTLPESTDTTANVTSISISSRPNMLYSTQNYPSVAATVGCDVLTQWGRGKVLEIRNDTQQTHVVQISSWRLAGRSTVKCFVAAKDIQVVRPYRIYDMSVFEKVEHANDLKTQATTKFVAKDYDAALQLYAKAVDAVRYIQHGPESSNELRADLVVVMVTCSNNSGTCCLQLKDWEHAAKYGINALALVDALEKKKDSSKILKIMNKDGISDSQILGTWKVKVCV